MLVVLVRVLTPDVIPEFLVLLVLPEVLLFSNILFAALDDRPTTPEVVWLLLPLVSEDTEFLETVGL